MYVGLWENCFFLSATQLKKINSKNIAHYIIIIIISVLFQQVSCICFTFTRIIMRSALVHLIELFSFPVATLWKPEFKYTQSCFSALPLFRLKYGLMSPSSRRHTLHLAVFMNWV